MRRPVVAIAIVLLLAACVSRPAQPNALSSWRDANARRGLIELFLATQDESTTRDWLVVDMKRDWIVVYPPHPRGPSVTASKDTHP